MNFLLVALQEFRGFSFPNSKTSKCRGSIAQIMAMANGNKASEVVASRMFAAILQLGMWEYEQASAAQMFSDRNQFAVLAAFSQGLLGQARRS